MKKTNIKNVYAIYDEKAEGYNSPFPVSTDGLAKRSFEDACKDVRTDLYKYPGDFTLYCIATWDDDKGQFENIIPPRFIAKNVRVTQTDIDLEKIEKMIDESKEENKNNE